jgi:hypothetical protein
MYVAMERVSILKNGSRQGYFADPHRDTCSSTCVTPLLSFGGVRNPMLPNSASLGQP